MDEKDQLLCCPEVSPSGPQVSEQSGKRTVLQSSSELNQSEKTLLSLRGQLLVVGFSGQAHNLGRGRVIFL